MDLVKEDAQIKTQDPAKRVDPVMEKAGGVEAAPVERQRGSRTSNAKVSKRRSRPIVGRKLRKAATVVTRPQRTPRHLGGLWIAPDSTNRRRNKVAENRRRQGGKNGTQDQNLLD